MRLMLRNVRKYSPLFYEINQFLSGLDNLNTYYNVSLKS